MKFGFDWPTGFRGEDVLTLWTDDNNDDDNDDGRRSMGIL